MKSRRELFEEQLRDLQKDISSLSNKLATPSNDSRRPSNDSTYGICVLFIILQKVRINIHREWEKSAFYFDETTIGANIPIN